MRIGCGSYVDYLFGGQCTERSTRTLQEMHYWIVINDLRPKIHFFTECSSVRSSKFWQYRTLEDALKSLKSKNVVQAMSVLHTCCYSQRALTWRLGDFILGSAGVNSVPSGKKICRCCLRKCPPLYKETDMSRGPIYLCDDCRKRLRDPFPRQPRHSGKNQYWQGGLPGLGRHGRRRPRGSK